ncbi:MAG TPA: hypothetical protein VEH06_03630 [Candidatus Bathyarchaeia archaeon]|nr:hypothetical protein [Candidatus Bathyarchaeia archaeon]
MTLEVIVAGQPAFIQMTGGPKVWISYMVRGFDCTRSVYLMHRNKFDEYLPP